MYQPIEPEAIKSAFEHSLSIKLIVRRIKLLVENKCSENLGIIIFRKKNISGVSDLNWSSRFNVAEECGWDYCGGSIVYPCNLKLFCKAAQAVSSKLFHIVQLFLQT